MLSLTLDAAERFQAGYPGSFWDGWTLVLFKPARAAEFNKRGVFHEGRWGYPTRVEPNDKGEYRFRVQ